MGLENALSPSLSQESLQIPILSNSCGFRKVFQRHHQSHIGVQPESLEGTLVAGQTLTMHALTWEWSKYFKFHLDKGVTADLGQA